MERRHSTALFWSVYAAAALAIDFAATHSVQTPINWRVFHWQLDNGFDVYKFLAWFAVPFILNIRNIQVSYFTFAHWRKIDWILLGLVVGVGAIIMVLIPYFPSARQLYGSRAHLNMAAKWSYFRYQFLWILSWLIG